MVGELTSHTPVIVCRELKLPFICGEQVLIVLPNGSLGRKTELGLTSLVKTMIYENLEVYDVNDGLIREFIRCTDPQTLEIALGSADREAAEHILHVAETMVQENEEERDWEEHRNLSEKAARIRKALEILPSRESLEEAQTLLEGIFQEEATATPEGTIHFDGVTGELPEEKVTVSPDLGGEDKIEIQGPFDLTVNGEQVEHERLADGLREVVALEPA
jgi:hypothetical protein